MPITYQNSCLKKLDRRGDHTRFFRNNLRQPERAKKPWNEDVHMQQCSRLTFQSRAWYIAFYVFNWGFQLNILITNIVCIPAWYTVVCSGCTVFLLCSLTQEFKEQHMSTDTLSEDSTNNMQTVCTHGNQSSYWVNSCPIPYMFIELSCWAFKCKNIWEKIKSKLYWGQQ